MKYYNKLIFEMSKAGRIGFNIEEKNFPEVSLPTHLLRSQKADLPEVSELDVVRHYTNVSQKNFGVENGFYPLGSCTMKYNPKINDELATLPGFANIHPLQPVETIQGLLKIYYDLQHMLSEISGLKAYSLNPFAGAHGELAGLMIIKAYHEKNQDFKRNKIIIPDSAKEKPAEGEVIAVGKGKLNDKGERVPLELKKGDRVLFSKYGGTEIKLDGEDYLVMREDDVLAVVG